MQQKIEQLREQAKYNPAVQQQLSSALIEALKKFGEATEAASIGYAENRNDFGMNLCVLNI